jgi:cystathionine gamma-lyase
VTVWALNTEAEHTTTHTVTVLLEGNSAVGVGVNAGVVDGDALKERLGFLQNAIGAVPSAFDCWLAHRGLKTLHQPAVHP